MSKPFPSDDPFLRGNYAPWLMEGEAHDLPVVGDLPRELDGSFFRNGPNPQFAPRGRYHWFDGDGMIHAVTLRRGHAHYRNRWVRTQRFQLERAAGEALFGGLTDLAATDPRVVGASPNAANTNVLMHAGRLLALWEGGPPHELDPRTLETLGPFDFGGRLQGPMTAHPKLDPESGEMIFFGYSALPPFLRFHVASAEGELVRSEEIEVPVPTMMHDFCVTREHVLFLVCPAVLRLENLGQGRPPLCWEPELGTRLGVVSRRGGGGAPRWLETDPCYVFHPMNAYTDGDRIVADVCRYPRLPLFGSAQEEEPLEAKLTRWTLDLAGGSVKEERLDDAASEFPRLDERRSGLRYRHGYAAGRLAPREDGTGFDAVLHYDHERGVRRAHVFGGEGLVGEPVFVPRRAGAPEGEGFLLCLVYRPDERRSDLVVFDAENVEAEPLARVQLPHRVPFGFHGNWAPGV